MPERVQLRRTKGWRKPEGAVVVSRPSRWGNPWTVAEWVELIDRLHHSFSGTALTRAELEREARDIAATCFREAMEDRLADPDSIAHEMPGFYPSLDEIRAELGDRDLCCWCPLDQPCHADVLLEIANQEQVA